MPRKPKDITADIDAILAQADEQAGQALAPKLDDKPEWMLTSAEWAERWGCARTTSAEKLGRLVAEAGWVRKTYRIRCGGRTCYPVPHYGPAVG